MISEKSFCFQIFETFWNIKINFSIIWDQYLWKAINTFGATLLFSLNFDTIRKNLEAFRCDAVIPGFFFYIYLAT